MGLWLAKGPEGADHVSAFSKEALLAMAEVDLVDLELSVAREFSDQGHLWRACQALLNDSLDTSFQERSPQKLMSGVLGWERLH